MGTVELEAKRMEIIRKLLEVNEDVLSEIEDILGDSSVLSEDVPIRYSPEALRKVVLQSEEAIQNKQVYTSEEIRAMHPRL